MDLRNAWVTLALRAMDGQEAQDLAAAHPLPRLAQAADPKLRPGTWVEACDWVVGTQGLKSSAMTRSLALGCYPGHWGAG